VTPFPELAVAFCAAALVGYPAVVLLRRLKAGQVVRAQGPESHARKAGTPTLGGVIFLTGALVGTLLFDRRQAGGWVVLAVAFAFGALGAADDLLKIRRGRSLGLRGRDKLVASTLIALALAAIASAAGAPGGAVLIPGSGRVWQAGILFVPLVWLTVFGTTSAVNETDGLDGLAGGLAVVAFAAMAQVTLRTGPLSLPPVCLAFAGGLLGFLVFNLPPARVFMGDTGALAVGGALAAVAVLSGTELFLLPIGGVFVLETLSVIVQVASFRLTGRRILRMSPLHHHFELLGWREFTVTVTFWAAGAALAALGAAAVR
jgi:phospho-N-acetylmuramoyl-pentapeptide-transferase